MHSESIQDMKENTGNWSLILPPSSPDADAGFDGAIRR
uniref:Uncharacterized protein n=1 Tax=Arundo donax TaxID=35708 RepID=A0A0A9C9K6_ARUDO